MAQAYDWKEDEDVSTCRYKLVTFMPIYMNYYSPAGSIHVDIPPEACAKIEDVDSDGWCGFRALAVHCYGNQDLFMRVKKQIYQYICDNEEEVFAVVCLGSSSELALLKKRMAYGVEEATAYAADSFCPKDYWFESSADCQLAANTFNRPVAIFSDDPAEWPTRMSFPIRTPPRIKMPPMSIYHVNRNHFQAIELSYKKMEWPGISPRREQIWRERGLPHRLKDVWKNLNLKKVIIKSNEDCPFEV